MRQGVRGWIGACLLVCLLLSGIAGAEEGAPLSTEDLQALEPAYEAFLLALEALLAEKGLLSEAEREAWRLYQLGDFLQNGGFGTLSITYLPGLLGTVDESVSMRRFVAASDAGIVRLETLQRYVEAYSPLPGLPLDAEVVDERGRAVRCRLRWVASRGMLLLYDGPSGEMVEVGATYISDGRPLYWYSEPYPGDEAVLALEILHEQDDVTMGLLALKIVSGDGYWMPEVFE